MENNSEKRKEKRKVEIRFEVAGVLLQRLIFLKSKYQAITYADLVRTLIHDKYHEFKQKEGNPETSNCDEVDIFEGDFHVARLSVHKDKSEEMLEHINHLSENIPKEHKKIKLNGKEIKVG